MGINFTPDYYSDHKIQNMMRQSRTAVNQNTDKAESADTSLSSALVSYDTVSFEQKSARLSDQDFAASLAKAAGAEIRRGVSSDRVAELKAEVQSGQYQPNSMRIAQHMLGHQ